MHRLPGWILRTTVLLLAVLLPAGLILCACQAAPIDEAVLASEVAATLFAGQTATQAALPGSPSSPHPTATRTLAETPALPEPPATPTGLAATRTISTPQPAGVLLPTPATRLGAANLPNLVELAHWAAGEPLRSLAASTDGRWLLAGNSAGVVQMRSLLDGSLEDDLPLPPLPTATPRPTVVIQFPRPPGGSNIPAPPTVVMPALPLPSVPSITTPGEASSGVWRLAPAAEGDELVSLLLNRAIYWKLGPPWQGRDLSCSGTLNDLAAAPVQRLVAVGCRSGQEGGEVVLFQDGQSLRTWDSADSPRLAFSPDGAWLAVASHRKDTATGGNIPRVEIWPAGGGPRLTHWEPGVAGDWIVSLHFSPDGERLALLDSDEQVQVWQLPGQPGAEPGLVWSLDLGASLPPRLAVGIDLLATRRLAVQFSPEGSFLAVLMQDGVLRLWFAADGQPLGELRPGGFSLPVATPTPRPTPVDGTLQPYVPFLPDRPDPALALNCFTFDASGRLILAGGENGVIYVWGIFTD